MSAQIMLILGRDGMGADATEADFDAWVAYVDYGCVILGRRLNADLKRLGY